MDILCSFLWSRGFLFASAIAGRIFILQLLLPKIISVEANGTDRLPYPTRCKGCGRLCRDFEKRLTGKNVLQQKKRVAMNTYVKEAPEITGLITANV